MKRISYDDIINDPIVLEYIKGADGALAAQGFTEHSLAHVGRVAADTKYVLEELGYSQDCVELGMIAAFMHDIGNLINRTDHSQSGALMAFRILDKMGMEAKSIATVVSAIGNHDEGTGVPVNAIAAALILADKSDVRRSRVRNEDVSTFDIHDRVNYSVTASRLVVSKDTSEITLELEIDGRYSSVMEYFEIFLERMVLCRRAAEFLGLVFHLSVNGQKLL